ncbi:exodeoxyribonuclease III [Anaerofustis sp.]|uniref:exodeoxyribonuclease III n=1 Tax=Anaerofustis sp. TaxID=1872517 RepID=UPI0025C6A3C9|nr:exodeoxyribonuclease III [Anaerofustis sp.]
MKLVTWNVNGLRACVNKGFMDFFNEVDADVFSVQETKLQEGQIEMDIPKYEEYWDYAQKKGYSGTACFTKVKPLSVKLGLDDEKFSTEGRVVTLEFEDFYLVNVYTPNSQNELKRLDYRMEWEDYFADYLCELDKKKPVIMCGDLNVAHKEIDLKNPKTNKKNAGFTIEEREKMTALLDRGFIDSYRFMYPDTTGVYTWWSYRFNARKNNAGWRIDYFIVSDRIKDKIKDVVIFSDVMGSDHCPVMLDIDL